ncbi:acylneuraminate cytidylyltransferase family protein [uncultured Desulfobacter sp.]|uniref:acylneuraminate cytidylyltransferase family protein n=1 Tax=uncultured Desulfobacter sp. TaxID=240139 RepID=UPI0029F49449|nr:acylneuraminate cytidylyltransferase family protein [uncultured Desulfobacter sp.]
MYTIAIIPAKMTSQRFKGKNLKTLCGQPLVYYSIQAAKVAEGIDDVFVSSESQAVLDFSSLNGVKTIIRPEHLSSPEITTQAVLTHAYEEIGKKKKQFPDLVVLLQPTHPLRMPENIAQAVKIMKEHDKFDCLFSLMPTDELRGTVEGGCFVSEFNLPRNKSNEPEMFRNTGSFYIFRPGESFLTPSFFGKNIYPFILERSPFEIDIDYASDMELAKCLLDRNKKLFPHFEIQTPLEDE